MKYSGYEYKDTLPIPDIPHRLRYNLGTDYFAAYCGDWRPCKTGRGKYRPTVVIGAVVFFSRQWERRLIPNENYYEFMEKYCE